ncbi:MAG: DNA repair protein RecO [Paludibacter sp.]|nr:DNA repair protein RecO [Paludibacter sp.]
MQVKTTGIVFHKVKHSDSATIINVFTQHFGRVAYIVYGANKKKSVVRASFLQPLSIVEMDVFHAQGKNIQQIKDIRMKYNFTGIPFDPVKNSLALFLSELLYRVLHQSEPDDYLFLFLENSVQQLDCCGPGIANFHLVFLLKLTQYIGFEPNNDNESAIYFDLMNGVFKMNQPHHPHFLSTEITALFKEVLKTDYTNLNTLILSREMRIKLLQGIIDYYCLHVPGFQTLHSLEILQSLFD